jgi:hypothetical protein
MNCSRCKSSFYDKRDHSFKKPSLSYKLAGVPQPLPSSPTNPSPFPCGLVNLLPLALSFRSCLTKFSPASRSTPSVAIASDVLSSSSSRAGSPGSGESPRTDASSHIDAPVVDTMDVERPIPRRLLLCLPPALLSTLSLDATLVSVTNGNGASWQPLRIGLGLPVAPTMLGLRFLTLPKLPTSSCAILR